MTARPTVAALWIGGALTWLEQLCLTSFVAQGHPTVLYTYGPVTGIPDGVTVKDGREVVDTEDFFTHARTESVALFSDYFRFHLFVKAPGTIWIDTDIYCHRPIDFTDDTLFGYETYEGGKRGQVNGAVMTLPTTSKALKSMLEFMEDPYPIPDWLPPRHLQPILDRRDAGDPMHVGEMVWGIWGPVGLTAHLRMSGEIAAAHPRDVFYPVHFSERKLFLHRPAKVEQQLTDNTRTIHLWAPIKKIMAKKNDGLCPPGSFLETLVQKHQITPADAPIPQTRNREVIA